MSCIQLLTFRGGGGERGLWGSRILCGVLFYGVLNSYLA